MRVGAICLCFLFSCVVALGGQSEGRAKKSLEAEWLYLGEKPPGSIPIIFAAGLISGAGYRLHGALVIRPDKREICWSVIPPAVVSISLVDSTWSDAAPMPLEGRGVHAPVFLADGTRLFYQCVMEGGYGSLDIWWKNRTADGWSEPVNAGSVLNSNLLESQPSVTNDGTLYFTGTLEGVGLNRGIYRSSLVNGEYSRPELLGDGINTEYIDYCPWIAGDESYLLFASSRPRSEEILHLHVSFREPDGRWSEPVNIHPVIGFDESARFPSVSPDGRFLFFVSGEQAYWVDMITVTKLKTAREGSAIQPPHN